MPIISLQGDKTFTNNSNEVETISGNIANFTLDNLLDVAINSTPVDGQFLVFDAASGEFKPTTVNISDFTNDSNYLTNLDDIVLQSYTTGSEPAAATAGTLIFNTTTSKAQVYNGTTWIDLH